MYRHLKNVGAMYLCIHMSIYMYVIIFLRKLSMVSITITIAGTTSPDASHADL